MTPKDLEDIRSWRRGEWVADITEIESMVYGLVDELDRLRTAVEGLHRELTESRNGDASEVDNGLGSTLFAMRAMAYQRALNRGRELGLWK